jgi:hypothetical protein
MNKHDFLATLWEELDLPFDIAQIENVEGAIGSPAVYIDLADGTTFILSLSKTYAPAP